MISYRDQTFCEYDECKKFNECDQALTQQVKDDAKTWWGGEEAPICMYAEKPNCFERRDK